MKCHKLPSPDWLTRLRRVHVSVCMRHRRTWVCLRCKCGQNLKYHTYYQFVFFLVWCDAGTATVVHSQAPNSEVSSLWMLLQKHCFRQPTRVSVSAALAPVKPVFWPDLHPVALTPESSPSWTNRLLKHRKTKVFNFLICKLSIKLSSEVVNLWFED